MENPDFEQLVPRIQAGEDAAMEQLYKLFSRGIRYYLCRQLGPVDLEDKVHDTFLIVVNAIQRGDLREPGRLMGFIRTVVRRQVAAHIEEIVTARGREVPVDAKFDLENEEWRGRVPLFNKLADKKQNPEKQFELQERAALVKTVLESMVPRDREVLTRFYLDEQPKEQICTEMNLTPTQFRLIKSRAKDKFGEIGKRKATRNELQLMQLRNSDIEKKAA